MPGSESLRFDRFELLPRERLLLADGQPVALGGRAFDLLVALASRPGRLITKSELLDEVWADVIVEEANLAVQMSALRKVLGSELIATIPGRGYRFAATLQAAASPESVPVPGPVPPPPHGLVGRDADLAAVRARLAEAGCVTLVGPAGVGKTALARALAATEAAGAVWVDLAPLTAASPLGGALARALGVVGAEPSPVALAEAVAGRLLVLDNAEHLVDTVARTLAALVAAQPALRVLATSQLRLAVAGEHVHRLEPLALPAASGPVDVAQGAVALLLARMRQADHRLQVTEAQHALLRDICRRLDGLPLALEMAAARVPALGLVALAQSLEHRLDVLRAGRRDADPRHHTLQAALAWSHALLSPEEQRLYRWCGVFSGGFTLDLLVDVAGPQARWQVVDTLAQLVDRSLVEAGPGDVPRYRLLETMREDAVRRLEAAGEAPAARAAWVAALARLARRHSNVLAPQRLPAAVLQAEHDNAREAIAWAREHTPAEALVIAEGVAMAATFSSWRLEALHWLEDCEAAAEDPATPLPVRAAWWRERARQRLMSKDGAARRFTERALEVSRSAGDDAGEFLALASLARLLDSGDEGHAVIAAMRELLERHPEWPPRMEVKLLGAEGMLLQTRGQFDAALACRMREQALLRQSGDHDAADAAETNVVFDLQLLGRHEEALERARRLAARLANSESGNAAYAWLGLLAALRETRRHDEFRRVLPRTAALLRVHRLPYVWSHGALLAEAEGRPADMLRLGGYCRTAYAQSGQELPDWELRLLQPAERRAIDALGETAAAALAAEGAALDEDAALSLMLAPA